MNDKADEVMTLSDDGDIGECDDGTTSSPAIVPKKRGRPSGPEKPKKVPSGRGRGRPKGVSGNKKPAKAAISADGSEEEGSASDSGSPVLNGNAAEAATNSSPKRGAKPKGKRKLSHTVESTGKGRGRPKKAKADVAEDDEAADDDEESGDNKYGKKVAGGKAAKKGRGRPKKVQNSDDESSDAKLDDDEDKRSVGRPPSGGVNLNVVRTGKGQGRPKKAAADKPADVVLNGNGETTKKRGRPSKSGKGKPYSPSGKPRGRPKSKAKDTDSQEDVEETAGNSTNEEEDAENSSNENDDTNSEDKV